MSTQRFEQPASRPHRPDGPFASPSAPGSGPDAREEVALRRRCLVLLIAIGVVEVVGALAVTGAQLLLVGAVPVGEVATIMGGITLARTLVLAVLDVVGLVIGLLALRRTRANRAMAGALIGCSIFGLLLIALGLVQGLATVLIGAAGARG